MNVGICTPYRHCDTTYAAIQLAEHARQLSHGVTLFTQTSNPARVHPFWDTHVVRERNSRFTQWAEDLDLVIWMRCPHPGQIEWAIKHHPGKAGQPRPRRFCVIVANVEDEERLIIDSYGLADRVMSPSLALCDVLVRNYKLTNVVSAPWCVRGPITVKDPSPRGRMKLLLPLVDLATPAQDNWSLIVGCDVLTHCKHATMTIVTASRSGHSLRYAGRWVRVFRGRVALEKAGDYEEQLLRYGRHDMTIIPYIQQTFGMTAISSAHMGTPFIAFNYPPVSELIMSGRAAAGIPVRNSELNTDSYARMIDAIRYAVTDGSATTMHSAIAANMAKRAEAFSAAWDPVFWSDS